MDHGDGSGGQGEEVVPFGGLVVVDNLPFAFRTRMLLLSLLLSVLLSALPLICRPVLMIFGVECGSWQLIVINGCPQ